MLDRLVEHRYGAAVDDVATLRDQFPEDSADELANRLIRRYAKELAIGGAVSGGAAASPVAGVAVAAASAGADATFSVGRLGEMIMAIGLVYGHDTTTVDERRAAIVTIMGLADGAAVGMSGLAARAGAKGGARVLQRIPTTPPPATAGAVARRSSKLGTTKGPWSLTALIPYGIGAGVGAAGQRTAGPGGRARRQGVLRHPLPHCGRRVVRAQRPRWSRCSTTRPSCSTPNRHDAPDRRTRPDADADDIVDAEIVD